MTTGRINQVTILVPGGRPPRDSPSPSRLSGGSEGPRAPDRAAREGGPASRVAEHTPEFPAFASPPASGRAQRGTRAFPEARGASPSLMGSGRAPRRPPSGLCRASLRTGPPQKPRRLPSNREAKTQATDGMRALGRGVPARRITRLVWEPG